jgi:hypothetical protein
MTLKTQVILDLEFTSSCSEADLHSRIESIISQMFRRAKDIPNESWNRHINVSWDESFPVETQVRTSHTRI